MQAGVRDDGSMDETRVDRWIWAVRLFKTRSAAKDACTGGHVRINGSPAKAAGKVQVGDRILVRLGQRDRDFEVSRVIDKRVGAAVAAACFVDHSPPEPEREVIAPIFERERGAGRPTKRDRRVMDRHRNR